MRGLRLSVTARFLACLLALGVGVEARAQTTTPPPMPVIPDEPLPEWHPPPSRKDSIPIFLSVSPELVRAQQIRQAGMAISGIGWAAVLGAGLLYPAAVDQNRTIGNLHVTGVDLNGNTTPTTMFEPWREDLRNREQNGALSLAIIGGAAVVGGFVLFTIGQWKISSHHKRHKKEPLPPLSGY